MNKIHFGKKWYIARLKLLERKLDALPNLALGTHRGKPIIRFTANGVRHQCCSKSKGWDTLYSKAKNRKELLAEYNQLLKEFELYFGESYEAIKSAYCVIRCSAQLTSDDWESFIDNECTAEKIGENVVDGHKLRSRIEMSSANAINELGLPYKYDCSVYENYHRRYVDFAINLEELDVSAFVEVMGSMDDASEVRRNASKFEEYSLHGFMLGRDWTIVCGGKHMAPDVDSIKRAIVTLVDNIADLCVMKSM